MSDGPGRDAVRATRLGVLQAGIFADAQRLAVPVTLSALCNSATVALGVVAVAVSVPAVGIGMEALAASGPLARVGEELQVTVGEGPSLEMLSSSGPLLIGDLVERAWQARWPLFAPAAFEAGIASLCVVPMRIGAARFGILAAYLDRPGGLDPAGIADAVLYAVLALDLVLEHLAAAVPDGEAELAGGGAGRRNFGDARPVDDRPEIHQATGMVSVQLGVSLTTALLRIRARAFSDGRMLSEVAADVVARRLRFAPESDGDADSS